MRVYVNGRWWDSEDTIIGIELCGETRRLVSQAAPNIRILCGFPASYSLAERIRVVDNIRARLVDTFG